MLHETEKQSTALSHRTISLKKGDIVTIVFLSISYSSADSLVHYCKRLGLKQVPTGPSFMINVINCKQSK